MEKGIVYKLSEKKVKDIKALSKFVSKEGERWISELLKRQKNPKKTKKKKNAKAHPKADPKLHYDIENLEKDENVSLETENAIRKTPEQEEYVEVDDLFQEESSEDEVYLKLPTKSRSKKQIVPGAEKQIKDHSVLAKKTRNKKQKSQSKGFNPPRNMYDDWKGLEENEGDSQVKQIEAIMDQGYGESINSGDQTSSYDEHQIPLPTDVGGGEESSKPKKNRKRKAAGVGGGEECSKPKNVRNSKTSTVIAEPNKTASNTPSPKSTNSSKSKPKEAPTQPQGNIVLKIIHNY